MTLPRINADARSGPSTVFSPCSCNLPPRVHSTKRIRSLQLICKAVATQYQTPSSITAATELSALGALSEIVPDTFLSRSLHELTSPKAATVSAAVLYGILRSPGALREAEV